MEARSDCSRKRLSLSPQGRLRLIAASAFLGLIAAAPAMAAGQTAANAVPALRPADQSAHVPLAVVLGSAQRKAELPAGQRLKIELNLQVRNQEGLDQLLQKLYDPASLLYHQYLSVQDYTERFGPTQADYDTVVSWARAKGFTISDTPANRRFVAVEGSVDVVNRALNVKMTSYRHPTEDREFFAPDREPSPDLSVPLLQLRASTTSRCRIRTCARAAPA
jgi:xanthomonalisin